MSLARSDVVGSRTVLHFFISIHVSNLLRSVPSLLRQLSDYFGEIQTCRIGVACLVGESRVRVREDLAGKSINVLDDRHSALA